MTPSAPVHHTLFIPHYTPRALVAALLLSLGLGVGLGLTGCGPSESTLSKENDQLRRTNLQLQREVDDLNRRIEGRLAQLEAAQGQGQAEDRAIPGADVPVLTSISFGAFSGPSDSDNDGYDDTLRIYLVTEDQLGRFIPVAGTASLQTALVVEGSTPTLLSEKVYTPQQLESAFRSGFVGTHYTLQVPLDAQRVPPRQPITVQVTLHDAGTGAKFTCQNAYPVRQLPPSP